MDIGTCLSCCSKCIREVKCFTLLFNDMELPLRTLAFRSSIILGLVTAVATVLYFTPLPDQYPQSCSRSCHELDWPMICRVKLTLERYQTFSRACGDCPKNSTNCYEKYCVTGDGRKRGILTVNRQFPGPDLRVCQNDIILVDIVNRVPGQSFGVHWRGQSQRESPHMDGVPMITQCPIPSFTTFQYKFRATQAGTHMWQINTGEEMLETLFGAFIVKRPDSREIHRDMYDVEDPSHVITVHTLGFRQNSITSANSNSVIKLLINGKVEENGSPPAVFYVVPGMKYRFRMIFGGDTNGCPVRVTIDGHEVLVLAVDGNPIKPRNVTSLRLAPGERIDFVLRTDQPSSTYEIQAEPDKFCREVTAAKARLVYEGTAQVEKKPTPSTELSTVSDEECEEERRRMRVCPDEIESLTPVPREILVQDARHKFYLFYTIRSVSSQTIYNTTFIATEDIVKIPQANNKTMMFPSSPLLTQIHDIGSSSICSGESCDNKNVCECIHILQIHLGAVVELVLVNQDEENYHIFHLHGHHFYLVGSTILTGSMTPEEIKNLDNENNLIIRNLNKPMLKDTIAVPNKGISVLRFKANNPGYWLLDEEHSSNWSRGMAVVLHVGRESDVPDTPANFPQCGNWVGPEFFLE